MNTSDIIQIMDHFSKSGLAEMKLKQEQFSLLLKKESNHPEAAAFAAQTGLQAGTGLNNESGTGSAVSANAGQNTLASGQADAQNADLANRNLQTSSTGQAETQGDTAAIDNHEVVVVGNTLDGCHKTGLIGNLQGLDALGTAIRDTVVLHI